MITAIYASLLALFYVFLSFWVVKSRFSERVGVGDGGKPKMMRVMRVHGNFAEYVPFLLILMLLLDYQEANATFLHIFGIFIIISRGLHAFGLSRSEMTSFGRFTGALITFLLLMIGALYNLYLALYVGITLE